MSNPTIPTTEIQDERGLFGPDERMRLTNEFGVQFTPPSVNGDSRIHDTVYDPILVANYCRNRQREISEAIKKMPDVYG